MKQKKGRNNWVFDANVIDFLIMLFEFSGYLLLEYGA